MCQRFWRWFEAEWKEQDRSCFETLDVIAELQGKDYDREKKCKYMRSIVDQLNDASMPLLSNSFTVMVKSGET